MIRTGPGPYRRVSDAELRPSFYLVPQSGKAFMFSVQTGTVPGVRHPMVTPLLRAMLYSRVAGAAHRAALQREIVQRLPARNEIAIQRKLLSLLNSVIERPWAFAVCLSTSECHSYWREVSRLAGYSAVPSDRTGDAVSGVGIGALLKRHPAVAFGASLLNQMGRQSKDYYDFYARRLLNELALRGFAPDILR